MCSRLQPHVVEAATLCGSSSRVARCASPLLPPPDSPLHPLTSPYIPLRPLIGGVARCDGARALRADALCVKPCFGRCAATRARVGLWAGLG